MIAGLALSASMSTASLAAFSLTKLPSTGWDATGCHRWHDNTVHPPRADAGTGGQDYALRPGPIHISRLDYTPGYIFRTMRTPYRPNSILLLPGFHLRGEAGATKGPKPMSRTISRASSTSAGSHQVGRILDEDTPSRRQPGRTRLSLVGRGRKASAARPGQGRWACPDCGLPAHDADAARLGFCSRCHDFTGMCSAGRKVVCPDMMTLTTWHTPCTSLGVTPWQIDEGRAVRIVLLCAEHDRQVRSGQTPWIREAVPLADLEDA